MQIRKIKGKDYVLCVWRHKFVRLTPEEWVRQHFLHHLVEDCHYLSSRIAVEVPLDLDKRADAIIYDAQLRPWMLIEFKQENIALSQDTLDQASVYNRQIGAPYLVLCNGANMMVAQVSDKNIAFLDTLPNYPS